MSTSAPLEIERKFLIRMPDPSVLLAQEGVVVKEITQTYLTADPGATRRVRKTVMDGTATYRKTEKQRISVLSAIEVEVDLTEADYLALLREADPTRHPIQKTRMTFPFAGHLMEIDMYPFWEDRAILEIELTSEEEEYAIPSFLSVIREVSGDKRYKNVNLARAIVNDPIDP